MRRSCGRELRRGTQVPRDLRVHEHGAVTTAERPVPDVRDARPERDRYFLHARLERGPVIGHPLIPLPGAARPRALVCPAAIALSARSPVFCDVSFPAAPPIQAELGDGAVKPSAPTVTSAVWASSVTGWTWPSRSSTTRRLGVPGRDDRVAPEVAPPRVEHRPAQHRVVRVAGVVVGGVDLQPVPVGVAQVHVERVGHAVPAGTALDVRLAATASRGCRTSAAPSAPRARRTRGGAAAARRRR